MSTLRISNIEAKSVPASATVDEKVKITNSSGDTLVFIDGKTSGITTVGINTTDGNIKFDENSNVVVTGIITATRFSGQITPTSLEIGSNIKLGNAGVITATSFVGSGANLTNLPTQVSITGNADNRIITGGSGVNLTGESNLNFDGTGLGLVGHIDVRTGSSINTNVTGGGASGTLHKNTTSGEFAIVSGGTGGNNYLTFYTSESAAPTEKLRIAHDGKIKLGSGGANVSAANVEIRYDDPVLLVRDTAETSADSDAKIAFGNNTHYPTAFISHVWDGTNGHLTFHTRLSGNESEKLRVKSDGNVTIADGNLVVASGHGIDFSATSNAPNSGASMSNELLDDYEEGSFTPIYMFNGTSSGITQPGNRLGRYTKIGNRVLINIWITGTTNTSHSGYMQIGGLPFNNAGSSQYTAFASWVYAGFTNAGEVIFRTNPSSDRIEVQRAGASVYASEMGQSANYMISGNYMTD